MNNEIKTFKIYNSGRLDYVATYSPIIKQNAINRLAHFGNKVDFFFVNSRWPRQGEL